jgi:hypothetical protein
MQPLEDPATPLPGSAPPQEPVPDPSMVVSAVRPPERGGPEGPEPTRFGDWERKGRCIDF